MKIVYIDMDDTLCDFTWSHSFHTMKNPEVKYPQSQWGFFSSLYPLEGAIEAVNALLDSKEYSPHILTAPSIKNPLCYTEKRVWVGNHLGMEMVDRLIISSHKNLLKGDYLIDDNISGKGQDKFEGELLHFGETFPDWRSIREYLNF